MGARAVLITAAGYDELVADEHDDPACDCEHCERARTRERNRARMREAMANGGLSSFAHEILGPKWFEVDDGGNVETIDKLAQKALGDLFEQLVKVCEVGRTKCRGAEYGYELNPAPVTRAEIKALIDYIDGVQQYALSQVAYLRSSRFGLSDRVFVCVQGEAAPATVVGHAADGRVRVRLDAGGIEDVDEVTITGAAQ